MKKILIVVASVMISLGAYGQGTVNFANIGATLDAPILNLTGAKASGSKYKVELLAGATAGSLTPVPGGLTALSDNASAAGYFLGGTVTLANQAGGSKPFFQVRAWDSTGGALYATAAIRGESTVFQLGGAGLGGGGTPPAPPSDLIGLTSFRLVPEPSVIALALVGGAALLLRRRK
jgi:hypothetical protein